MSLSSLHRDGLVAPGQSILEIIFLVSSECRAMILELGIGGRRARYTRRMSESIGGRKGPGPSSRIRRYTWGTR